MSWVKSNANREIEEREDFQDRQERYGNPVLHDIDRTMVCPICGKVIDSELKEVFSSHMKYQHGKEMRWDSLKGRAVSRS